MWLINRRIRESYRDMPVMVADDLVDYHIVLNGSLKPGVFDKTGQQSVRAAPALHLTLLAKSGASLIRGQEF